MPSKYASGKWAIAQCDRCDQRYLLKELKKEIIKTKLYQIKDQYGLGASIDRLISALGW